MMLQKIVRNPYLAKLLVSIIVAVAAVNSFSSVMYFKITSFSDHTLVNDIYKYTYPVICLIAVVFVIGFPLLWQRRENRSTINTDKVQTWFVAIIRYWLALEISGYGFAKFFHLQFGENFVRNDSTVGSLSGFSLTWNYFGYSNVLNMVIGFIQVAGSVMLLFRKTTLLGVMMLLPVMVNIVLIDVLYNIPLGATLNAIYFTTGLLYLLFLHWDIIRVIITKQLLQPAAGAITLKWAARLLVIGGPFAFALLISLKYNRDEPMAGKWAVKYTIKNNKPVDDDAWLKDAAIWQNVYIEHYKRITCSPNPFVVDANRSQTGEYTFNANNDTITLNFFKQKAPLRIHISHLNKNEMEWNYLRENDTIKMVLVRRNSTSID